MLIDFLCKIIRHTRIDMNSHLSGHVKMLVDSVDRGDLICLGETFGLLIVLIKILKLPT